MNLPPSMADFIPCDRLLQKAYCAFGDWSGGLGCTVMAVFSLQSPGEMYIVSQMRADSISVTKCHHVTLI